MVEEGVPSGFDDEDIQKAIQASLGNLGVVETVNFDAHCDAF